MNSNLVESLLCPCLKAIPVKLIGFYVMEEGGVMSQYPNLGYKTLFGELLTTIFHSSSWKNTIDCDNMYGIHKEEV